MRTTRSNLDTKWNEFTLIKKTNISVLSHSRFSEGVYWKIWCPPKMKQFLWQIVSGCIAVKKNLRARGMQGGICCTRCGGTEESINHIFLNVHQQSKFEHSKKSHRIELFLLLIHFSQIWIIYFGEFSDKWKISIHWDIMIYMEGTK